MLAGARWERRRVRLEHGPMTNKTDDTLEQEFELRVLD
jgi:hypothetical protein